MVRNRIYRDLFNFRCPKKNHVTWKQCSGKLHPTNTFTSTLEFICNSCRKYTTMNYEKANLIITDTKNPPKSFRSKE